MDSIKEQIYTQMNGQYVEEFIPEKIKGIVDDEFADGSVCNEAYDRVHQAAMRLNDRLGTEEDTDVECIIDNMLTICRELAYKMFDYGKMFERY